MPVVIFISSLIVDELWRYVSDSGKGKGKAIPLQA
jgi:hypothetical protein